MFEFEFEFEFEFMFEIEAIVGVLKASEDNDAGIV
jgi:hypothetical protein